MPAFGSTYKNTKTATVCNWLHLSQFERWGGLIKCPTHHLHLIKVCQWHSGTQLHLACNAMQCNPLQAMDEFSTGCSIPPQNAVLDLQQMNHVIFIWRASIAIRNVQCHSSMFWPNISSSGWETPHNVWGLSTPNWMNSRRFSERQLAPSRHFGRTSQVIQLFMTAHLKCIFQPVVWFMCCFDWSSFDNWLKKRCTECYIHLLPQNASLDLPLDAR